MYMTPISYTPGMIQGDVVDEARLPLFGVTVTIESTDEPIYRIATTDDEGRYEIGLLSPGTYLVSFVQPGFTVVLKPMHIQRTTTAHLDVTMTHRSSVSSTRH